MPWQANNNPAGEIRAANQSVYFETHSSSAHQFQWLTTQDPTGRCQVQQCAYVHAETFSRLIEQDRHAVYMYARSHPQFLILVRPYEHDNDADDVTTPGPAVDEIYCSELQLINFEICTGEVTSWSIYLDVAKMPSILQLTMDIRLRKESNIETNEPIHVCVRDFTLAIQKALYRRIVTENERIVFSWQSHEYFLRCTNIEAEDRDETEFTMPDAFRGLVDAETCIHLTLDGLTSNLQLDRSKLRPIRHESYHHAPSLRPDVVVVRTSDDEEFPVKKKLLFPCIALTSAVLAGRGVHETASSCVQVEVSCCTFDRVLLYLECEAKGRGPGFGFDPMHTEALLEAALTLGCAGLEDVCRAKLGEFESRVRHKAIRWVEVLRNNQELGHTWLVMDGMVFDVTRWLPEHPGGSTIIPAEALNVDSTVMFEIYHSSRQSFRYLKQFYIGEIHAQDLACIPMPEGGARPSPAFVEELRGYTTWRIQPEEEVFKSF